MQKTGVVLFAHGARRASWAEPFEAMRDQLQNQLADQVVHLAYLELMTPSLEDAIGELVVNHAIEQVVIVPLFLSRGGHIAHDLPQLVKKIQSQHTHLGIEILPVLTEMPAVQQAIGGAILEALGSDQS